MEKNRVVITILFIMMFQTFAHAQGTELFRYVDENSLKDKQSEFSILTSIKNLASSIQVHVIKFSEVSLLSTKNLIKINLPGISVLSTNKYIEQDNQTSFTWFGHFDNIEGSLLLSVTNNDVVGMIHISDQVFSIKPLGSGFHALVQIDQSKFPCEQPCIDYNEHNTASGPKETKIQTPETQANITQSLTTLGNSIIDILVVYTPASASSSGNIFNLINGCISTTNNISSNSDAFPQVRLVYSGQVEYTESGSLETDVDRLSGSNDGYIDNVHSIRNQYGADVVVLLVASGDNCGYVYDIEVESGGAFAVVRTDCAVDNYSFAHEVGHLVGGRHDTDNSSFPRPYAHGYCKKGNWKTVMAINYPATRIPFWSNPYEIYNGQPMGTEDWNNVTRVWNERGTTVQNFLPTKVLKVPEEFSTISSALAAATSGQAVSVSSGSYSLSSSIMVPSDEMLHLNPNVTLSFAPGTSLIVNGTLNAVGTPSNKITFNRSGTTGTWGGIIVSSQASASLSYCNISYAGYGVKYSDNNSASVYNCNISNCTYGIYSSQYYGGTVANNTITGCTTGIYIYNNRLSVYGNTITATNYGIYTYNNTSYVPYIYNNTISTNGSGIGIYCGPNSSPRLMTPGNGHGANTLQSNNIAVYAVYGSYPFLGSTNYPGYNRILNSTTYHIQLYMAGPVYAQYNWWGESTPDASKFYTNTGAIYYSPYLTSDPNISLSTTTEGSMDGTMTILSKNITSVSTLEKALNYELSGDYGNAMKIYKTTFEQELNSDIGRYCLTKIQICYDSLGQTDFDLYADKFVAGSLKNSDLGAARIELTNKKLLENRNYDQALKNMEAASANTNYSEEVRKINLYSSALLYFNTYNDVDKAKEIFTQFKEQYPNDRLNDDAEILLGSIFSAKLNKEAVSSEIVSETQLFDNYPNPFNPTTTINYSVKEAGLVKIKVYDILGCEIEMLVNEVQDIGNHSVGFNASNLPSGVYIYTLESNGFSDSKKMLLLK